jgi:signal peptidase I
MKPTMNHGDLVVVKRQPSYHAGEIVAYRVPKDQPGAGTLVIHRVIGTAPDGGYVLRGDNRRRPDIWRPRASDIEGELRMHVPGTGKLLTLLRTPLGLGLAGAALTFLLLMLPARRP